MHGYELRQRLERGLGALWHIASSQLYSVLHRLGDRGWVVAHVESDASRPSRTVYETTVEGARAFEEWVTAPVEHLRDMRIEFLAKIYFLRRRSGAAVAALCGKQIEILESLDVGLARHGNMESDDAQFGATVLSFRRKRMRSMIEWLREQVESMSETEEER